jgi:hypothetical protein
VAVDSALVSFEARIENVLARSVEAGVDDELRSSLARYACVLTSGYIEETVRTVLGQWCAGKSHAHIGAYVSRQLEWFANPKYGRITDLLGHFSLAWRESFEAQLSDEEKDAIDSVVSNRHQIAHGRNVGISPIVMKRYFTCCRTAMKKFDAAVTA